MSYPNNQLESLETELEELVALNLSNSGSAEVSYCEDSIFDKEHDRDPDLSQYLEYPRYPYPTTTTTTTTTTTSSLIETPLYAAIKHEPDDCYQDCHLPHPLTQPPKFEFSSDDETEFRGKRTVLQRPNRKRKNDEPEIETAGPGGEKITKRRERNRESAAASRQRKREHITTLEKQIQKLKEERVHLGKTISSVEGENRAMREEINHLQNLISNSPLLSGMWTRHTTPQPHGQDITQSPIIKAAFFLFLVLFCVFNTPQSVESQPKIIQPLLNNYFHFLATDGRPIPQDQLQDILNKWLTDPLGLQSQSGNSPEQEIGPDFSHMLSQYLLLATPSGSISALNSLNPSLYDAIFQVVSSLPRRYRTESGNLPSLQS